MAQDAPQFLDEQGNPTTQAASPPPSAPEALDAQGNPAPVMNFAIVNGRRVPIEPDTGVGAFVRHFGAQVNPLPIVSLLPTPDLGKAREALAQGDVASAAGQATGLVTPITAAAGMLQAQGALFDKAKQAYDQGDYVSAAAHALHWLLPVIGPVLDQAGGELQRGKYAAGAGDTLGLATSIVGPGPLARGVLGTRSIGPILPSSVTPVEAASNAFAAQHGIPLDAATATGSRFARGLQKGAGESLLGSPIMERVRGAQEQGLGRAGEALATQVHPDYVPPEEAGAGLQLAIRTVVGDKNLQATHQYGILRRIEANPKFSELVQTAPRESRAEQALLMKLAAGHESGMAPTADELKVMRQIEIELESQPYTKGKLVSDFTTNPNTGDQYYTAGAGAGAPVYHEMGQATGSNLTRGEMLRGLRKTLEEGQWTVGGRGAYEVARQRIANGTALVTGPRLPTNQPLLGRLERVGLPVALKDAKGQLTPLYDRLKREAELIPLQGDKGRALVALDRLINGPDLAPLSIVDAALSDLKSLARTDIPELRSPGKGAAAEAVAQLEHAVQQTVQRAGPEAQAALVRGRSFTQEKYAAGEVLKDVAGNDLSKEPVRLFRTLTAKGDAAFNELQQVLLYAPEEVPKIARAWLQQQLDLATQRGRFDHADRLYADWQKLGPASKRILFPAEGQVQALDDFFLLAKRLSENPNPSGTAVTAMKTGEAIGLVTHPLLTLPPTLTAGALAKILYSPAGVRQLTRQFAIGLNALQSGNAAKLSTAAAALQRLWPALVRQVGADAPTPPPASPTAPARSPQP